MVYGIYTGNKKVRRNRDRTILPKVLTVSLKYIDFVFFKKLLGMPFQVQGGNLIYNSEYLHIYKSSQFEGYNYILTCHRESLNHL